MPSIGAAFRGRWVVYFGALLLFGGLTAAGAVGLVNWAVSNADGLLKQVHGEASPASVSPPARAASSTTTTRGQVILTQDWSERLNTPEFWNGRSKSPYAAQVQRSNLTGPADASALKPKPAITKLDDDDERHSRGTYRAVCVRLCDGYYWPVNFATTTDKFARARKQCESSCSGTPARLFVYRNPGEQPEDMRDLDGQPYSKLPTALLYRSQYNESCKCTPHPWEQEAQDRHRLYALEAARKKGDKVAAKAAEELKSRLDSERRGRTKGSAQKAGKKAQAPVIAAAVVGTATPPTLVDVTPSPVPAAAVPSASAAKLLLSSRPKPPAAPVAQVAQGTAAREATPPAPLPQPPPSQPPAVYRLAAAPTPDAPARDVPASSITVSALPTPAATPSAPAAAASARSDTPEAPQVRRLQSTSKPRRAPSKAHKIAAAPAPRGHALATRAASRATPAPVRVIQASVRPSGDRWQARAFREN